MDTSSPRFLVNRDNTVNAVFDDRISEEINQKIHVFQLLLAARHISGLIETVLTCCMLVTHYDPCPLSYEEFLRKLRALTSEINLTVLSSGGVLEIPVLYGEEVGPDLAHVAEHAGISEAEVIKPYSEPEYLIYTLGFTPGFIHFGGLNLKLETSRLETPRVLIPAGSVDVAGKQTNIYPIASPDGWQLTDRTPARMYNPNRGVPILLRADQYIHFSPITEEECRKIETEVGAGVCRLNTRK